MSKLNCGAYLDDIVCMTTVPSRRPRRQQGLSAPTLLQAFLIAAATFVSAQVLKSGLIPRLAGQQPESAVSLGYAPAAILLKMSENQRTFRPDSALDPDPQADVAVAKSQADIAWIAALAALDKEPLNAATLRALGQAASQRGDTDKARRLMQAASALSHRESVADTWLANDALARKNYGEALGHIDALLRTDPESGETAMAALDKMAVLPEAQDALVALLAANPPWRASFLDALPVRTADPSSLQPLYTRLLSMKPPIPDAELKSFLDVLIRGGMVENAYYFWLKTLPEDRLADLTYLYNGDLRLRPSNLPFDWELNPIEGATATIDTAPGSSGRRALMVTFAEGRVPYKNAVKIMMLPPGRYQFGGRVRALDLDTQRGMAWRVTCLQSGTQLGETPRMMGTTDGWTPFEITFTVPSSACEAQALQLELAYRTGPEQQIAGSIWYDSFRLERIEVPVPPATSPAPAAEQPVAKTAAPQPRALPPRPDPKTGKR